MFTKILVGIDASAEKDYAFDDALAIAKATGANLSLLHVFSWDDTYDRCRAMLYSELEESQKGDQLIEQDPVVECMLAKYQGHQQSDALLRYKTAAQNAGVHVEIESPRRGRPGRTLCDVAKLSKADLIAVGHHDKTFGTTIGLSQLRLGSVSHEVIHRAPCSVLIAQRSDNGIGALADIQRILVALDSSKMGQVVFHEALDLAKATGASLTLLHISFPGEKACPMETFRDKAKTVGVFITIQQIDAADSTIGKAICEYAAQQAVDLILVGRRRLLEVQEMILGSVSHYIGYHAPCGVIIVQPR